MKNQAKASKWEGLLILKTSGKAMRIIEKASKCGGLLILKSIGLKIIENL